MLLSDRSLLKSRVNTVVGSLLLASWALGCGLVVWHASFDGDPVESAFIFALRINTDIERY